MATVIMDSVTYAAMHDAFHDAPEGRTVNKGHVAVTIDDEDITYLISEQIGDETLSDTIMRLSSEIAAIIGEPEQKEAAE